LRLKSRVKKSTVGFDDRGKHGESVLGVERSVEVIAVDADHFDLLSGRGAID
jgi:hypothetical protein